MTTYEHSDLLGQIGYDIVKQWDGSCFVYQVIRQGDLFVAKLDNPDIDSITGVQIDNENMILEICEDMDHLSKVIGYHKSIGDDQESVLVKNYIDGITLEDGGLIVGKKNRQILEDLFKELHRREIYRLDFFESNIVIDKLGIPHDIDLGYAKWGIFFESQSDIDDAISSDEDELRRLFMHYYVSN
jgi:hypothetical protein